jgi:hypothetical protein
MQVAAGLRLTDGALVVVDCLEGMSLLTEMALRSALSERVKPVLVISKLDTAILELVNTHTHTHSTQHTIHSQLSKLRTNTPTCARARGSLRPFVCDRCGVQRPGLNRAIRRHERLGGPARRRLDRVHLRAPRLVRLCAPDPP